jgi:putative Holliday junction resolvase
VNRTSPPTAHAARSAACAGKILAIDYGRTRIGLAIAQSSHGVAQPLATLERVNRNEDMRRLRELVRDHSVKYVVVGLPLRLDGTRGEMAEEAERFARRAHKQIGIPVEMLDERLTSWQAEREMEEQFGRKSKASEITSRKKASEKVSVDSMAAAIILRDYLAHQRDKAEGGEK